MTDDRATEHRQLNVAQFTRMAAPFAEAPIHSEATSLRLLTAAVAAGPADRVLDVCCGTGIVACELAATAGHVTGVDLTPAMLDHARLLQKRRGVANVAWTTGEASALPFPDGTFDAAVSRYAFHHLTHPPTVLAEMARVCRPGGRVVVADVYATGETQRAAYDRVERLRDPSHASAMLLVELQSAFAACGLAAEPPAFYRLAVDLEEMLAGSRTPPKAAGEVRQLLSADVGVDATGMAPRRVGRALEFSFPVVVLAARKVWPTSGPADYRNSAKRRRYPSGSLTTNCRFVAHRSPHRYRRSSSGR